LTDKKHENSLTVREALFGRDSVPSFSAERVARASAERCRRVARASAERCRLGDSVQQDQKMLWTQRVALFS
jgi:hypothetical protein